MNHAPSSNSFEVVIVGSGSAGASAALCLATAGVKVAVLEKASLPRYKTCGSGVARRALRLLPLSIRDAVERDCFAAELNLPDMGLHFETRRRDPIVSMTMRAKFDSLLLWGAWFALPSSACWSIHRTIWVCVVSACILCHGNSPPFEFL